MSERRESLRYKTLAKVKIEGMSEGDTLLKDISITGCRVECTTYLDIKPNLQYKLEIIPEKISDIGEFSLVVETKWIRSENYCCEIGFVISEYPKKKIFGRYVDYLDWRNSQGTNSGSASDISPEESSGAGS